MRPFLLMATSLLTLALAPSAGWAEARNPYAVAVIIGNKTYQNHDIPEVKYADRDAQAVRNFVVDVLGYAEENIIYVENATESRLLSVFGSADDPDGRLAQYLYDGGKSDVLVYYSGHGVPGGKDGQAYLLPVDADPNTIAQNGYALNLLYANLEKLNAHSVTVLLDACFSGASVGGPLLPDTSVVTRPASSAPPAAASGLTWIAATGANQLANWDNKHKHGLFTEYFLEAVYGRADETQYGGHRDGKITLAAVQKYLDDEMSHTARRDTGRYQKATISGDPALVLASLTPDARPVRHDDGPLVSAPTAPPASAAPPPAAATTADELERQGEAALGTGDYAAALAAFRRAASLGQTSAMHNIGLLYEVGMGVPQDYAEAMRWFRMAAEHGAVLAMRILGVHYRDGLGVPPDSAEARRWFGKAAELGDQTARDELAKLGTPPPVAEPVVATPQTDEDALKLSDADRLSVQQWLAALGHNTGGVDGMFGPATRAAIAAYGRAIGAPATGYLSRDVLSRLRREGVARVGAARLEAVAKPAPLPAPEQPSAAPATVAGAATGAEAYQRGTEAAQRHDITETMRWFRIAAEAGNTEAMLRLSSMYRWGEGVPFDLDEARRWLARAAALGNQAARNELARQ